MKARSKISKYRKRRELNVGVIVFLFIFIYVLITVYIYFTKDHLSIYEVHEGSTTDNNIVTGLIIRDEEIINSDMAGYISYYHRDGDRVAKNSTIYSIDENNTTYNSLGNDSNLILSENDSKEIEKEILNFQKNYKNSSYSKVYDFKYELENTVLQISNDQVLTNLQTVISENGTRNSFKVVNTPHSGIVTYTMDNMENLTIDSVSADNFNVENYSKTQLRTMDLIETNSPIFKLIKSDNWHIIIQLDETQYQKLIDKETQKITFLDEDITTTVPITVYKQGSDYFARLDLDQYMIQFANERYVTMELEINKAKGLKIPVSAIVDKDFYQVPLEFFTEGGDSKSKGIIKEVYDENNELKHVFIPTEIYYSDDTYGYVDGRLFEYGKDWIYSPTTDKRFQLTLTQSLQGVFNVNKGYAIFRRIEILYDNEEYCIVKKDTPYGLSVYDHIALKGDTATEEAIIY